MTTGIHIIPPEKSALHSFKAIDWRVCVSWWLPTISECGCNSFHFKWQLSLVCLIHSSPAVDLHRLSGLWVGPEEGKILLCVESAWSTVCTLRPVPGHLSKPSLALGLRRYHVSTARPPPAWSPRPWRAVRASLLRNRSKQQVSLAAQGAQEQWVLVACSAWCAIAEPWEEVDGF